MNDIHDDDDAMKAATEALELIAMGAPIGKIGLVNCIDKRTGKNVPCIVAIVDQDHGKAQVLPLAIMPMSMDEWVSPPEGGIVVPKSPKH